MATTLLKNPVDVNVVSTAVGLQVSGTAADATGGTGAKPSATFSVTGTPGQATTGTGVAAGAGADIALTAGAGGAAVSGATNGQGGSVVINPGAPGAGGGAAAAAGNVLLATTGGRVGIGTTDPSSLLDIVGVGNGRTFTSTQVAAGGVAATFRVRKASTGMTPVASGHRIGDFTYSGFDGTDYTVGARMIALVDGAVSAGSVPTAITFSTGNALLDADDEQTPGDPNALTENLRITSAGNVGIGTPAPGSKLHVNGGVQVGAPTGGDMGAGTINVSGGIYVNGTPLLEQLEEARLRIAALVQRADELEAQLARIRESKS